MPRSVGLPCVFALTLLSCHPYEYYAQVGYLQASYSNDVDILFVTDNSESMEEENDALSLNFSHFMSSLVEAERTEAAMPHATVEDAVDVSIYYVGNFSRFIDYQVGMTTTEIVADPTAGQSGTLVLDTVLDSASEDIEGQFSGMVDWVKYHVASLGDEKGLDAVRLAICKGVAHPEQLNQLERDDLKVGCCDVSPGDYGATSALLRPGAPLAVVIVTDEGDFTDLRYNPQVCDPSQGDAEDAQEVTVEDYLDFFEAAGVRVVASVIGPTVPDEGEEGVLCNPSASPYSRIDRYRELVASTGGLLEPICDPDDVTRPNPDFATALEDIGALLTNLQNRFELTRTPDVDTIIVIVDDVVIPEDPADGWTYVESQGKRYVEFRGAAVPSWEAEVRIYYLPVDGDDPRTLPF